MAAGHFLPPISSFFALFLSWRHSLRGMADTAHDSAMGSATILKRQLRDWMDAFERSHGRGMLLPISMC
jgi:hypothetical protein